MIHFYEMMSNISLLPLAPNATLWGADATNTYLITFCRQRTAIEVQIFLESNKLKKRKNIISAFAQAKISSAFKNTNHRIQFYLFKEAS